MRTGQTVSNISDKLRDTADEADHKIRAASETVTDGLREGADTARASIRDGARQATDAVGTIVEGASAAGKDGYRAVAARTSDALTAVDKAVTRNPVGALAAALGVGLLLGLLARR